MAQTVKPGTVAELTQRDEKGRPEFCRPSEVRKWYGLTRTHVYRLIDENKIRSVSMREKGKASGVRLIFLDSVGEYLQRLMAEQEKAAGLECPTPKPECQINSQAPSISGNNGTHLSTPRQSDPNQFTFFADHRRAA